MSTISASTLITTALQYTADTTGTLVFKTGATPTTALTLNADQSATFAGTVNFATAGFTNLSYTGTFTGGTGVIAIGTNQIYKDAAGLVGIGTATPASPLDVVSQASDAVGVALRGRSADNVASLRFYSNDRATFYSGLRSASDEFRVLTVTAIPITFYTTNTERMRIDSSGNVVIGATTGAGKFTVTGGLSYLQVTAAGTQEILKLDNSNTAAGTQAVKLSFSSSGVAKASITSAVYGNGYMDFAVNTDTFAMRIDASGNVGIGTTITTVARLTSANATAKATASTINSAAFCSNDSVGSSDLSLVIRQGGSATQSARWTGIQSYENGYGAQSLVLQDLGGNVGIGTSSPSTYNGLLNVKGADRSVIGYFGGTTYATRLGANSSYSVVEGVDAATGVTTYQPLQIGGSLLKFDTGGSERMRITSAGLVGIGTSSPRNVLTVNGVISGSSITTVAGGSNTGVGGGGCYMVFLSWNNGNGYAVVLVNNANLNNSGVIIASSNASGGNNAFDVDNNFASNGGNGIAFFSNGGMNLQTKNNWTGNAYPVYINFFGM